MVEAHLVSFFSLIGVLSPHSVYIAICFILWCCLILFKPSPPIENNWGGKKMVSRLKKRKNHSSFPNEESVNLKRVEEMAKECAKLDVEEERGDEFELNLELSIGGMYRQDNSKGKITKFSQENVNGETNNFVISRSNFPNGVAENVHEHMDLQRRKEIQALRRQEARRKREEKIKKAKRQKDGVGLAEEAKKLKARVEEREGIERDCFSEEKPRKNDKNSSNAAADDLSLSLFTDDKFSTQQVERECLYPKVHPWLAPHDGFRYSCGVFPSPVDCNSECRNKINDGRYRRTASYKSLEQCSSAVSDYLSMSHKGGSSSDTGSHSSLQPQSISRSAFDQLESHDSTSQAETDQVTNNVSSTRQTSCRLNEKPPNPSNYNHINAASFPRMPCVSATGNGPNGRTIMGFLYKYTKAEVSIVCVCHGSSFSPAEFVEHAGGVDISQPLKHITVVPAAFG